MDRALLFDLWGVLNGDNLEYIYVENLRVMAQVILRLIDSKRVLNVQSTNETGAAGTSENGNAQAGEIGFTNHKDQFCVRQQEVGKI
jgi:hypothetical protein